MELIIEKGSQIIHQATQLRSLYSKHLKVFSWKTGSGLGWNLLDTLQIKHKHPNATSLLDLYTGHWTVILIWWKSKFLKVQIQILFIHKPLISIVMFTDKNLLPPHSLHNEWTQKDIRDDTNFYIERFIFVS